MHPLSEKECNEFGKLLQSEKEKENAFLHHNSILPENVLYFSQGLHGEAVWYTPVQKVNLYFTPSLGIADGDAILPALLWKASKNKMQIWAIKSDHRPRANTALFLAPFFNIYGDGSVCMGNVKINISQNCSLTAFIAQWQTNFFASTFSHSILPTSPIEGNIVQLWQNLVGSGKEFPTEVLKTANLTIKDILP
jgi:PRTRC genetic system protein B